MIKALIIKNFLSHKFTKINFAYPGVNAFCGDTDEGKTAILTALGWVCLNNIQGDFFINWEIKRGEWTSVKIILDNGIEITRRKNKTKNQYILEKDARRTIFNAVGSTVPYEIKEIININDVNFQGPDDIHFLLNHKEYTESSRAKFLNNIIDLSSIDSATQKANHKVKFYDKKIKQSDFEIEKLESEIKDLEWIKKADKLLKIADKKNIEIEKLKNLSESLFFLTNKIKEIEKIYKKAKEIQEKIRNYFLELDVEYKSLKEKKESSKKILYLIKKIELIKKDSEFSKKYLHIFSKYDFNKLANLIRKKKDKEIKLKYFINAIKNHNEKTKDIKLEIENAGARIKNLNIKICPLCGSKIKGEK